MSTDTVVVDKSDVARVVLKIANGRAVVSPAKAAELLDCGLSRIYKLLDANELPSFLIGGRRKISVEDIAKLVAQKRAEPFSPRVMPWDHGGLAERKHHPRREAEGRVVKSEEPQQRPVGRPRKSGRQAPPRDDAAG